MVEVNFLSRSHSFLSLHGNLQWDLAYTLKILLNFERWTAYDNEIKSCCIFSAFISALYLIECSVANWYLRFESLTDEKYLTSFSRKSCKHWRINGDDLAQLLPLHTNTDLFWSAAPLVITGTPFLIKRSPAFTGQKTLMFFDKILFANDGKRIICSSLPFPIKNYGKCSIGQLHKMVSSGG